MSIRLLLPGLSALGVVLAASLSAAQFPDSTRHAVDPRSGIRQIRVRSTLLASFRPGTVVRVQTAEGRTLTRRFLRTSNGVMVLQTDGAVVPVPIAQVDRLWVRGTAIKQGAIAGAIVVGFFVGWAFGGFASAFGGTGSDALGAMLVGVVGGGAGGAVFGAGIGAPIPRWHLRYPSLKTRPPLRVDRDSDRTSQSGDDVAYRSRSASVSLGYAKGLGEGYEGGGSQGGRANLLTMMTPTIGAGAEIGYYRLGATTFVSTSQNIVYGRAPDYLVTSSSTFDRQVWQITTAFHVRRPIGKVRPYVIGGSGLYILKESYVSEDHDSGGALVSAGRVQNNITNLRPGFNLGGGVEFLPDVRSAAFVVESRLHVSAFTVTFFTITAGVTFR